MPVDLEKREARRLRFNAARKARRHAAAMAAGRGVHPPGRPKTKGACSHGLHEAQQKQTEKIHEAQKERLRTVVATGRIPDSAYARRVRANPFLR